MPGRLLGLDVVVVVAFVLIGRRSHEEAAVITGVLRTAAPFLIALGVGWTFTRAWTRAASPLTGVAVAAVTVSLGMILRRFIVGDGTAGSFIVVATVFLTVALVGWRLVYGRFVSPSPSSASG